EFIKSTFWASDCRAWYRKNETGRANAVYPGSSLQYCQITEEQRYEDYNITYQNKRTRNWSFMEFGFPIESQIEGSDLCPYISEDHIDPKWLEEVIKMGALAADHTR
ncbi:hypothetical protein BJ875DRAFT_389653, partial [Amylocarpus encephaloides]